MAEKAAVRIDVIEADALTYAADVLVLKHAQALYGVDAKAVAAAGIDQRKLPRAGGFRIVTRPDGITADALLLIGVVRLRDFGYRDIRDFGMRALCSVASELPDARVVAMTIHGAGYGLDETEAFDAELAGLLDAIHQCDAPKTLERVVILEVNPGRARRLRARLADVLRSGQLIMGEEPERALAHDPERHFDTVGFDSADREHAFVAMPFGEAFDDLFHYGISAAVRSAGLLCERIDQQAFTGDVIERLRTQVESARLMVADLTGSNPNVFLEVGYAWGCGVPTVLMAQKGTELTFDVQGQRCLFYANIHDAERLLVDELTALLTDDEAGGTQAII